MIQISDERDQPRIFAESPLSANRERGVILPPLHQMQNPELSLTNQGAVRNIGLWGSPSLNLFRIHLEKRA
jgi:hypothetical protein